MGFYFFYPEDHVVSEQITYFAEAEVVIGVMGAAMCNSIFSRPGTKIVYIAPEGWNEVFFWDLANQMGHSYYVYYSLTSSGDEPPEEKILELKPDDFLNFYQNLE